MSDRSLRHPAWRRRIPLSAATAAAVASVLAQTHAERSSADVAADRAAATQVRAAIAAEERRINATAGGLAAAEARLAKLSAREQQRRDQFLRAQDRLVRERIRLSRLQTRSTQAKDALGTTLAESYRRGDSDLATIVVSSGGLADAIERVEYEQRVHRRNARVLEATRIARTDAAIQEAQLADQEQTFQALATAAAKDRDAANAVRTAMLRRQASQLARSRGAKARLSALQGRIRSAEAAQIRTVRAQVNSAAAVSEAPRITGSSNADSVVARVVAAANQIATTPYVWGGGHGGAASGGYDCSGSLSYALAAGGLLSSPLTSGGFMSWGVAGVGQRITVYANGGHAYMVVDGRRFDTSALRSGGTRWTSEMRSNAGFVARHPAGL
jgi:cell wall-associated NlpC family hydrolase